MKNQQTLKLEKELDKLQQKLSALKQLTNQLTTVSQQLADLELQPDSEPKPYRLDIQFQTDLQYS